MQSEQMCESDGLDEIFETMSILSVLAYTNDPLVFHGTVRCCESKIGDR